MPPVDTWSTGVAALRARFPVFARGVAYLNTGTNGPVPASAELAAREALHAATVAGRSGAAYFERWVSAPAARLRARAAAWLGAAPDEVALTRSTTDGINIALAALPLRAGDEVVTSDEEHPGLLAPLARLAATRGVRVRTAPLRELANAVGPRTRLVACSHVSWVSGAVAPVADLAATGVPLLYDGAQALGAIAVDVRALACDFYAAPAQKWLCGPNGLGFLYVRGELVRELEPPWPSYESLADTVEPLARRWHRDARRFDTADPAPPLLAWALAALDELERVGRAKIAQAACDAADAFAAGARERGLRVAPRGRSTLVSVASERAAAAVAELAAGGVVVREIPGRGLVRVSVGAWNDGDDRERCLRALVG